MDRLQRRGAEPLRQASLGLLTLIVSLEAIFLSAFVMISQDREAQRSEIRAQLDFETNVLGEVWTEMIAAKLGVDVHQVHEKVAERMTTPKPGSVEAGRLLEWPAHDRQQQLQGSRPVAPAGRTSCRSTKVVEGCLLGGLRPLGPLVAWPLRRQRRP